MESELNSKNILSRAPTTRYRGSKRRILPWLHENIDPLKFETVLDGFGGTGSVSFLLKMMGKEVTFNDILKSNYQAGISLIENNKFILTKNDIKFLIHKNGFEYPSFVQETFKDIYYLNDENEWLDVIIHNIQMLSELYSGEVLRKKQALSYNALFQACLCKRPYNLFHRKNLYMRTADVERTFCNKTTWERSFDYFFVKFSKEISEKVFSNKKTNKSLCSNILDVEETNYDLLYLDPPYISNKSRKSLSDYQDYYHFLEGIVNYSSWDSKIDHSKKNKPLLKTQPAWSKKSAEKSLDDIFKKFSDSIIVTSYGEPGYPSIETIVELLHQYKKDVDVRKRQFNYTLNRSTKNGDKLHEVLIIAK
ncbi:MAG: DNA adenine methylase [Methanoregula sp.]|jgi:adenine-specific DNA methylase|nr:DNA adenine methylase [Methanoregula sp.]